MLYQSTRVGFGYGLGAGAVSWKSLARPPNPIRADNLGPSSRPGRLGNVRPIPIGYGLRPRLRGPANPARINLAQEPLDFRREGFSPSLNATHVSIRTSDASSMPHGMPSPAYGTLRYHSRYQEPGVRGQDERDQLAWRPCSILLIST
jgi:hypothetical protein